jgi:hypothetical protein
MQFYQCLNLTLHIRAVQADDKAVAEKKIYEFRKETEAIRKDTEKGTRTIEGPTAEAVKKQIDVRLARGAPEELHSTFTRDLAAKDKGMVSRENYRIVFLPGARASRLNVLACSYTCRDRRIDFNLWLTTSVSGCLRRRTLRRRQKVLWVRPL